MLVIIDLYTEGKPKPMNKDNVIVEKWSHWLGALLSLQSWSTAIVELITKKIDDWLL